MRSGLADAVVNVLFFVSSVRTVVSLFPESSWSPSSFWSSLLLSMSSRASSPSGRRFGMMKESGIAETGVLSFLPRVELGFHSVGSRSGLKLWSCGGLHAKAGREVAFIGGGALVCSS